MSIRSPLLFGTMAALFLAASFGATNAQAGDKLENIKVLPKNIKKQELDKVMDEWSRALGVKCSYCHEKKTSGGKTTMDWASDAKEEKKTTRRMFKMLQEINAGPMPKAAGEKHASISCISCHRGLAHPATLDQVMVYTAKRKGAGAAVQKYKDLKGKYYGSGSYDFTAESLGPAIRALAEDPKGLDSALALAKLDVENFPKNADAHVTLAQILMMKGDKAGANKSVDDALGLDPKNRHALRMKKRL
jgi:hypothetical protein